MPRALVELSSALPGVELYPFPVISSHMRVEDWLADASVTRLIGAEYVKYLYALARSRLIGAGLAADPAPQPGQSVEG
jgi:hypothetical protein